MALSKHSAYDNDNDEGERLAWRNYKGRECLNESYFGVNFVNFHLSEIF